MSYKPLDNAFFLDGNPTPSIVSYLATANAETIAEVRLNGWGLFWPAGVVVSGSDDLADLVGMVYTAAHGENSTDYSGLYVSTPAGRPMSIPIPVVLSGRAAAVRVLLTYAITGDTGATVTVGAQVARNGSIYPRPWTIDDLPSWPNGTPTWDNAESLSASTVGADEWGVVAIDVEDIPLTYSDDAPGDGTFQEASHVILTLLSHYPEGLPATSPGTVTIRSAIEWAFAFNSIKPHIWLEYSRPTTIGQDDFAETVYGYVLSARSYSGDEGSVFLVWPPYDPGTATLEVNGYLAPAIRILAIRIEEVL
jgi:hypothetical protein